MSHTVWVILNPKLEWWRHYDSLVDPFPLALADFLCPSMTAPTTTPAMTATAPIPTDASATAAPPCWASVTGIGAAVVRRRGLQESSVINIMTHRLYIMTHYKYDSLSGIFFLVDNKPIREQESVIWSENIYDVIDIFFIKNKSFEKVKIKNVSSYSRDYFFDFNSSKVLF